MSFPNIKGLEILREEDEASIQGGDASGGSLFKHSYAFGSADAYGEGPAGAKAVTRVSTFAIDRANFHVASSFSGSESIGSN